LEKLFQINDLGAVEGAFGAPEAVLAPKTAVFVAESRQDPQGQNFYRFKSTT